MLYLLFVMSIFYNIYYKIIMHDPIHVTVQIAPLISDLEKSNLRKTGKLRLIWDAQRVHARRQEQTACPNTLPIFFSFCL